jgi:hypothetical protein
METAKWRDAVRIMRGNSLETNMRDPSTSGRATAFDFSGAGGPQTWIGTVKLGPGRPQRGERHFLWEALPLSDLRRELQADREIAIGIVM